MPLGSSDFDPFWIFRWPFSGNVNERITAPWFSPSLTVNYAGDAKIEDRVVTEVASYGKQLGWLSRTTLRLLANAVAAIDTIKKEVHPSALEVAEKPLDRIATNSTAMSNIREHYRCVGPDRVSGWEKLQARFGRSAGPVYVPRSAYLRPLR